MAFDMYAGERHEAIRDGEEYIFSLAAQSPDAFPLLERLRSRFYTSFTLSPEDAGALVHELLALHDRCEFQAGKAMAVLVLRLAQFFSAASRTGILVRCDGD